MDVCITNQPKTRLCKSCGRDLPLDCYRPAIRTPDKISYRCNQCLGERKPLKHQNRNSANVDTTKTISEVINCQAKDTVYAYISECERKINKLDSKIASIKTERRDVAVKLANARRKLESM